MPFGEGPLPDLSVEFAQVTGLFHLHLPAQVVVHDLLRDGLRLLLPYCFKSVTRTLYQPVDVLDLGLRLRYSDRSLLQSFVVLKGPSSVVMAEELFTNAFIFVP